MKKKLFLTLLALPGFALLLPSCDTREDEVEVEPVREIEVED